jgi:ABC-type multidrug transport system fused ATPase/permease subunit
MMCRMGASPEGTHPPQASALWRLEAMFLKPYRWVIAIGAAGLLVQSLMLLPVPLLQGWVLDRLVPLVEHPEAPGSAAMAVAGRAILIGFLATLGCHVARMALSWKIAASMGRMSQEVVRDLRAALHCKLMRLPMIYFNAQQTGRLMARVTSDVGSILGFLNSGFLQLVNDLILAIGIAVLLCWLEWRLAIVTLIAVPLYAVNHQVFAGKMHRLSLEIRARVASIYALLSERVSAVRLVRSFAKEEAELAEFAERIDDHRALSWENTRAAAYQGALATMISGLGTVFVITYGTVLVGQGFLSVGELLAFYALVGQLYGPIVRLTQFQATAVSTRVSIERLFEIFDEPEPVTDRADARPIVAPVDGGGGRLEFRDVSFAYQEDGPEVLSHIDLDIEAGMTVGILGPSGAGKSTLLALAPRLYDIAPGSGFVRLDGDDVRELRLADLRRAVALVPQHALLFGGTIRSNLLYAAPDANARDIRQALEAADFAATVDALPLGLETPVGERGQSLSGGQRQRLALARALIADPAVLLLDDCTSALDSETEARVRVAVAALRPGRTTLIVSHKPSSVRHADLIIVLDQGQIIERGTHATLLARGGYYTKLLSAHAGHSVTADREGSRRVG